MVGFDFISKKIINADKNTAGRIVFYFAVIYLFILFNLEFLSIPDLRSVGIQFDYVYRILSLIPIMNPGAEPYSDVIFSIDILGVDIPLMYKTYISTVSTLPYLALWGFDDYLLGYRIINFLMAFSALSFLYYIISHYSNLLALLVSAMFLLSPIHPIFPFLLFFLAIGAIFLRKYIENRRNDGSYVLLFCAMFMFGLVANLQLYFAWNIVAFLFAMIIVYPKELIRFFSSWKEMLTSILGISSGLFNHVVYNISEGFPAVKIVVMNIFKPGSVTIDYNKSQDIVTQLSSKIYRLWGWWGEPEGALLAIIVILALCIYLFRHYYPNRGAERKVVLFFVVITLVSFLVILLSPNTTRRGHYAFLSPWFELSIGLILYYPLISSIKARSAKLACFFFLTLSISIGFYTVMALKGKALYASQSNKGHFTPAIFDLDGYLKESSIEDSKVIFLEWGFHSQLYFLSKGEFHVNQYVWKLRARNKEAHYEIFRKILLKFKDKDSLYFPLYYTSNCKKSTSWWYGGTGTGATLPTRCWFIDFLKDYEIDYKFEKFFYEKNGRPIIGLIRIDKFKEKSLFIQNKILSKSNRSLSSEKLKLIDGGWKEKGHSWISPKAIFALNIKTDDKFFVFNAILPDLKGYHNSTFSIGYKIFDGKNSVVVEGKREITKKGAFYETISLEALSEYQAPFYLETRSSVFHPSNPLENRDLSYIIPNGY